MRKTRFRPVRDSREAGSAPVTGRVHRDGDACRQPALILTGVLQRRHHIVIWQGNRVELTSGSFQTLAELVAARLANAFGARRLPRAAAFRLRKALATQLVAQEESLGIELAGHSYYRLAFAPEQIAIDGTFEELPTPTFLPAATAELIRKHAQRASVTHR